MNDHHPTVMLVAGEASGDQHAAKLFLELQRQLPGVEGFGMGGANMRKAGIDVRYDSSEIAVIGLDGLIRRYPAIRKALRFMQNLVCTERPDLLICVDYKEFNFRLARHAKACGVKVLFYVGPQFWAWRPGRVKKYGRVVDHMAVIFPFEVPFYEAYRIPVSFVGHPLADAVHPSITRDEALDRLKLDGAKPIVGLLPGSRGGEIKRLLPVMMQAAGKLREKFPGIEFVLVQAASVDDSQIAGLLKPSEPDLRIIKGSIYDAIQCCDAVITSSGTATLEVALLGVPMVITYKVTPLTYLIGRLLVNIPFIGLPNIIAGRKIVAELIQHRATPDAIADEVGKILSDREYAAEMSRKLNQVKERLGDGGGIERLAKLVVGMLKEPMNECLRT
ncbi:MAG: lipid-A-disaccharide synthase [Methylococcaceae bacterium]|nr:lipid-A-disaccharide synthase [Methylococcaceae bacterium]